ncbi:hypothetical protein [Streptomyces sp. ST2-7A]|uniref:hypothetical protein n=1 Tax=Streptomyces sp. ST2-7A TaxID=2907214 RepID=UPI001F18536F|nr:hypothetical protein [Streptomyces sp. ST2-7A]MCE7080711.1 hypothetical protein [Streptomyces sp. ST2-7A]
MTQPTTTAEAPPTPPDTTPPGAGPTPTTPETTTPTTPAASPKPEVRHTPGGLPAVPVAVNTANTLIGGLSAGAMTLGPVAMAASAVGMTVVAAGSAVLARRAGRAGKGRRDPRYGSHGSRSGAGRSGSVPGLRLGAANLRTGARSGGSNPRPGSGSGSGSGSGGRGGAGRLPGARTGSGSVGLTKPKPGSGGGSGASGRSGTSRSAGAGSRPAAAGGRSGGPVGAVRDLRRERRAADAGRTRAERRRRQVAERRAVADARRASRRGHLASRLPGAGSRSGGGGLRGRVRRARHGALMASRRRRDAGHRMRVEKARRLLRTAAARRRMRRRLASSWLRYRARTLAAAALSLPVGALGLLTTPLGRRLGWPWLMYPGRRLYRVLAGGARAAHQGRIGAALDEARAMDTAAEREITERVPRAPHHHRQGVNSVSENTESTENSGPGFLFGEAASEMESAAQGYDPDGMMQVLSTVEAMPEALQSVANVFQILAERSDSEFPLEKEVGEALSEVYTHLMLAVNAAADVPTTFRNVHEQDIRRHEDPRNNAEHKWDTTNNQ